MAKQDRTTLKGHFETGDIPNQTQYGHLIDSQLNLQDGDIQLVSGSIPASSYTSANNLTVGTNITASNNISASGIIYTDTLSQGNETAGLTITGNITASGNIGLDEDQRIYFEADKGTCIETDSADRIRFVVGGTQMLLLDQDDGRVNIGYAQKLGVGLGNHTTPGEMLEVDGNISASGDLSINAITASGLPTTSPTTTGSLWMSGSNAEGTSKYLMVFNG